jgi:hypothetical protein
MQVLEGDFLHSQSTGIFVALHTPTSGVGFMKKHGSYTLLKNRVKTITG